MRELEAMDDGELIWACVEPIVKRMRAKTFNIKSEVYGGLNRGQRGLFMFQMLRGHLDGGVEELFRNLSYLLCRPEVWRELKGAFDYFGCDDMAALIGAMELLYNEINNGKRPAEQIKAADARLLGLLPGAEKLIAGYIRSHPLEFS
jgi:hypothetical protein